jgi:hypothetical protein
MESVVRFLEEKLSLRVNRDSERCRSGWGTQIARPPAPLERQAWDRSQEHQPREGENPADHPSQAGR